MTGFWWRCQVPFRCLESSSSSYFPPKFLIWKENHPLNATVFLRLLAIWKIPILNLKFFHQQIIENLPSNEAEIVRFLGSMKFGFFLKIGFLWKQTFSTKSVRLQICFRIRIKWYYCFENVFYLCKKYPKIFIFGKITKFDGVFWKKKTLFKRYIQQNYRV